MKEKRSRGYLDYGVFTDLDLISVKRLYRENKIFQSWLSGLKHHKEQKRNMNKSKKLIEKCWKEAIKEDRDQQSQWL